MDLSLENDNPKVYTFYKWILDFESRLKDLVHNVNADLNPDYFISCIKNKTEYGGNLRTKVEIQKQSFCRLANL